MPKYKYIIALFVMGLLIWFIAVWAKITHQPFATSLVHISHGIIVVSCLIAVVKILFSKEDNFLNK